MKVEQLNTQQIDWKKPQVVVNNNNNKKVLIVTNRTPDSENTFSGVDLKTGEFSICWSKDCFKPETITSYPIELKLTIESDFELCNLLHRTSIKSYRIDENRVHNLIFLSDDSDTILHDLLEQLAEERNLYKND